MDTELTHEALVSTTGGDNFRTVTPENGTEYFISSFIDIIMLAVVLVFILIITKLKDLGMLGKLGVNKLKLFMFMKDATEGLREQAKENAIKEIRENDIKISGLHHMSKETIEKYDKMAKDAIVNKLKDEEK